MSRRFTGTTDYSASSVNFVSSGSHTVCGWIYLVNDGAGGDLLYGDTASGGASSTSIWLGFGSSGTWSFQEDGGGGYSFTPSSTLNAWTHLALTYDLASNTCKSYVNGALVNSATASIVASRNNFNWFDIGASSASMDFTAQDVFAFNTALTIEQIQTLMRQRTPVRVGAAPYLWWPLHGDSGTWDATGKGHSISSTAGEAIGVQQAPTAYGTPLVTRPIRAVVIASTLNAAGDLKNNSALVGATQALVASALADKSALVGAAVQTQPVASALADSSALVGATRAHVLSTLADSSALTGAAVQAQPVASALADSSALTGAAVQAQPVASALASSSALTGAAIQVLAAAGALASGSALSGTANVLLNVAGALVSSSALTGAAVQNQKAAGSLASGSALAGAAVQNQPIAGALANSSALTGSANTNLNVVGSLADSSALVGAAVQNQKAAGALADSSALTGTPQARIAASLADSSALAGAVQVLVAGAAKSGSALSGVVSITTNLALDLRSGSALSGTAVGGTAVVPYVPSGWFEASDTVGVIAAHGPWLEDINIGVSAHTPWQDEITTNGTVNPHSPWSEPL